MKAGKLEKGQVLELNGEPWLVVKAKVKGNAVKVVVKHPKKGEHASTLDAKAKVKLWPALPLHGQQGEQQRWAVKREAAVPVAATPKPSPKPPVETPWETPADRIEEKLDKILGARLIGVTTDGSRSFYVPPLDVSTVATHLVCFHARDSAEAAELMQLSEVEMLQRHDSLPDAIPHTHTETRPVS